MLNWLVIEHMSKAFAMTSIDLNPFSVLETYASPLAACVVIAGSHEETAVRYLRYDYFVCERGWVPPDPASPGLE